MFIFSNEGFLIKSKGSSVSLYHGRSESDFDWRIVFIVFERKATLSIHKKERDQGVPENRTIAAIYNDSQVEPRVKEAIKVFTKYSGATVPDHFFHSFLKECEASFKNYKLEYSED